MKVIEHGVGGLAAKWGATVGAGALGAIVLAAVSKEQMTRREVFARGLCAGIGSTVFGPIAVRFFDHYVEFVDFTKLHGLEFFEWAVPVYFLAGALSWGAFGALSEFSRLLRERAGKAAADKLLGKDDKA